MAAAFKKGDPVKARNQRNSTVSEGKFVKERPGTKGSFYDIDLGKEGGGVKSYRPSQVTAA
jgi:hypothetical protein